MYVMLLLLASAVCEWVEISQQYYRKPIRHHFQTPLKQTEEYAEETTSTHANFRRKPQIMQNYPNREMVTESNEHLTTSRVRKPVRTQYYPAEGITEVYVEDAFSDTSNYPHRKPTRTHHFPATERVTEIYFQDVTTDTVHHLKNPTHTPGIYKTPESTENLRNPNRIYLNQSIRTNLWNKGNVDKVSKYGNVQRVHPDSNAVKAPNLRINPVRNFDNYNRSDKTVVIQINSDSVSIPEDEEPFQVETQNKYTDKRTLSSNFTSKIPLGDLDQIGDKKPSTSNKFKNNTTTGIPINYGFSTSDPKSVFVTKGEAFTSIKFKKDKNDNFNTNSHFPTRINPLTEMGTDDKEQAIKDDEDITAIDSKKEHPNSDSENRPISSKVNKEPEKPVAEDGYVTISDDEGTNDNGGSNKVNQFLSGEAFHPDVGEQAKQTNAFPSNDSKANTVANLMALMKVVADTIRRSTRRSVNSKTKYLTSLKETILSSIKERIDITWPDDPPETQEPRSRSARSAQAQATPRGHLEIPSSESALMTISFLTFAVFLIKLVLQVIQTYKNKTMMVTPAVVATVGRAVAASKRSAKP